jgi:hypothetical protein
VLTRAARSYQEHARTGAKGKVPGAGLGGLRSCWGTRVRTWTSAAVSRTKAGRVADYTIPHRTATAHSTAEGLRLRVAVRTQEPEVLQPVIRTVAVLVIKLEN